MTLQDELAGERLARLFHETYERLAPEYGYRTREASAVAWDDVPEANRLLMVATAQAVLADTPGVQGGDDDPADVWNLYPNLQPIDPPLNETETLVLTQLMDGRNRPQAMHARQIASALSDDGARERLAAVLALVDRWNALAHSMPEEDAEAAAIAACAYELRRAAGGGGQDGDDDTVTVSWRDCSCEWATKFCDEMHTRTTNVSRAVLRAAGGGQ